MSFRRVLLLTLLSSLLLLSLFAVPASAQPALLIQKTWGGSAVDVGQGVAVDSSGNIYVAGQTYSFGPASPNSASLSLLKYNPTGSLLWQRIWASTSIRSYEYGKGVAVDVSGNIYVTGQTTSFGAGGIDVMLLKFNSSGSLQWQKTWGGSSGESGFGVAVDASGNIYVTGEEKSFGFYGDVFLLKFNSTGSLLWQKTWGGNAESTGWGVAVDSSGYVYLTGGTRIFGAGVNDILLLKFDSSGGIQWQRTWGGSSDDEGYGVAVDVSGNIYVTGKTYSFGAGIADVLLLKFNSSGSLQWQKTWGGSDNDVGLGVAVDSSGNTYVTGETFSFGGIDVMLLKFDSSGGLTWQKTWGGSGIDVGNGVAVDSSGNALVVGSVGEAPPYTLGSSGNNTLGMPTFYPGFPLFTLGTPTFTPRSSTGAVLTPSGSQSYSGSDDEFLMKYGFLPTVLFQTSPAVGSITFNGTDYTNGQSGNFTYGTVPISAYPSNPNYVFSSWSSTDGITVASPTASATTATVSGPGTLKANFTTIISSPLSPNGVLLAALVTTVTIAIAARRRRSTSRSQLSAKLISGELPADSTRQSRWPQSLPTRSVSSILGLR